MSIVPKKITTKFSRHTVKEIYNNCFICVSGLHCCEKAMDPSCRNTCIHELKTGKDNDEDVVDKLIKNCGDPLPTVSRLIIY